MASVEFKNNAQSTVADNPLTAGATTLNIATGEGAKFPAAFPFKITLWDASMFPNPGDDSGMEIIKCTARTADALTIVRAQEGTSGVEHSNGERVAMLLTAGHFNDVTTGIITKLDTVETNAKDDQIASEVPNTPAGDIAATDVQAAINELDVEKSQIANITDMDEQLFTNLLKNGDFESWSAGASSAPDGWVFGGTGSPAIERSTTKKLNTYSVKITSDGYYGWLKFTLSTHLEYASRAMTFGVWVKTSVANHARLELNDGIGSYHSNYHTGGGAWEFLTITHVLNSSLTTVIAQLFFEVVTTIAYIDGAILVEGSVYPAFSPKPLVDDGQSIVIDPHTNTVTIDDVVIQGGNVDGRDVSVDGTKLDTIETSADVTDTTNVDAAGAVMESDIPEQSFTNLLENGDFESWSSGVLVAPDGWILYGTGSPTIARENGAGNVKIGTYSAKMTTDGIYSGLYITLSSYLEFAGRYVTISVWVKTSTANHSNLEINDGIGATHSSYHTGGGSWELLSATRLCDSSLTKIEVHVRGQVALGVLYADGAILVEGLVCPAFSLKPLIDDGKTLQIDSNDNKITSMKQVYVPSSDTTITAAGGITVTNTIMRVVGSGGAIDITANPQIAAGTDGQIVIIQGTHDTNTVTLDDGTGLALSAQMVLSAQDNITLMYDSGDSEWIEISRTTVV